MKVKTKGSEKPHAWVVSSQDKGRKKIYKDNKIFLDDGEEFEIELFNPTTDNVLALISLDGKPISTSGLLVRPGERMYLDCFLDDLDGNRKFTFSTYDVESSDEVMEAISKNGMLEVFFYKEEIVETIDFSKLPKIRREEHHHHHYYPNWYYPYGYPHIWYTNTGTNISGSNTTFTTELTDSIGTTATFNANTDTTLTSGIIDCSNTMAGDVNIFNVSTSMDDSMETGQTIKGDISEQKFKEIEMEFEDKHISNVSYKLLPDSRKPKTAKDVSKASMEKVADKLSEGQHIEDFISRIYAFSEMKENKFIEEDEFELIRSKAVNSIIKLSSEIEIEFIDDLGSYIMSLGDLMRNEMISEEEFKLIKTNLFNQVK
jgi:hypothetical protein